EDPGGGGGVGRRPGAATARRGGQPPTSSGPRPGRRSRAASRPPGSGGSRRRGPSPVPPRSTRVRQDGAGTPAGWAAPAARRPAGPRDGLCVDGCGKGPRRGPHPAVSGASSHGQPRRPDRGRNRCGRARRDLPRHTRGPLPRRARRVPRPVARRPPPAPRRRPGSHRPPGAVGDAPRRCPAGGRHQPLPVWIRRRPDPGMPLLSGRRPPIPAPHLRPVVRPLRPAGRSQAAERRGAPGTARRDDGGGRPPSGGRPQAASREGHAQPGPDPRTARRPAHGSRRRRPPRARGGPGGPDRPRLRPHPSRRPDVGRPRRSRDCGRAPPLRGAGPPRIVVTGVEVIARKDPSYPSVLEEIADPPERLWVRGTLPVGPAVAIVGTRRATRYGLSLGREMGRAVARAGWVVVSGLARGIDGAAHRGCIDADGRGIAVLGCGIDVWYPPEHEALGRQLVAAGGAVVSEYPPGTLPEPWRFPARNRIISALAAAVVVVE